MFSHFFILVTTNKMHPRTVTKSSKPAVRRVVYYERPSTTSGNTPAASVGDSREQSSKWNTDVWARASTSQLPYRPPYFTEEGRQEFAGRVCKITPPENRFCSGMIIPSGMAPSCFGCVSVGDNSVRSAGKLSPL